MSLCESVHVRTEFMRSGYPKVFQGYRQDNSSEAMYSNVF